MEKKCTPQSLNIKHCSLSQVTLIHPVSSNGNYVTVFTLTADSEVHEVSGQWAAECGYTMTLDSWGDLLLRVSYLACLVENQVRYTQMSIKKRVFHTTTVQSRYIC